MAGKIRRLLGVGILSNHWNDFFQGLDLSPCLGQKCFSPPRKEAQRQKSPSAKSLIFQGLE
ncbi:MAG: hypothetical protein WC047_02475 [Kiritimatiellales bacterium]